MRIIHQIHLNATTALVDGHELTAEGTGAQRLKSLYRRYVSPYPRFYKMDPLAKVGFLASELLLDAEGRRRFGDDGRIAEADASDSRAVLLFSREGSAAADRQYEETVARRDDYFPSPALFVYTLPNIVTGEIAIRNQYRGETAFYLLDRRDDSRIANIVADVFLDSATRSVLYGWIDVEDSDRYTADFFLATAEE